MRLWTLFGWSQPLRGLQHGFRGHPSRTRMKTLSASISIGRKSPCAAKLGLGFWVWGQRHYHNALAPKFEFPSLFSRPKGATEELLHRGLGSHAVRFTPPNCVPVISDIFMVRLTEASAKALAGHCCVESFFNLYKKLLPPSPSHFTFSSLYFWHHHHFSNLTAYFLNCSTWCSLRMMPNFSCL